MEEGDNPWKLTFTKWEKGNPFNVSTVERKDTPKMYAEDPNERRENATNVEADNTWWQHAPRGNKDSPKWDKRSPPSSKGNTPCTIEREKPKNPLKKKEK